MTAAAYYDRALGRRRSGVARLYVDECWLCDAVTDGPSRGTAVINFAAHLRSEHGLRNKPYDIRRTLEQTAYDLVRETFAARPDHEGGRE